MAMYTYYTSIVRNRDRNVAEAWLAVNLARFSDRSHPNKLW